MSEPLSDSEQSASVPAVVTEDGGWWPPGHGEPGTDWDYESTTLRLIDAGDAIEVVQVVGDGERALVSIPVGDIARCLAEGRRL